MRSGKAIRKLILKGIKAPIPEKSAPTLCTLVKEPVSGPEYLHEINGMVIASPASNKGELRMYSRSLLDYPKKYPPIVAAMNALKFLSGSGKIYTIGSRIYCYSKQYNHNIP